MDQPPVIVVGTGRCGSTLVSRMLGMHPEVADISEVFSFVTDLGARIERAFPFSDISTTDFWSILSDPQPRQNLLLQHGLQMAEVTYQPSDSRFEIPLVPPIVQSMVPTVAAASCDALYDDLQGSIMNNPVQPVADHYRSLFEAVTVYSGKRIWVERSGGGLRLVERLRAAFPDAKIVHLVRDGRATALSMQSHIGFRMALLCGLLTECLGVDPFESDDRSDEDDLSDELVELLPERFSADAFCKLDLPASLCGHYWSGEIIAGLAALDHVPADRLLTVHYEDLVNDPTTITRQLGRFITGSDSAGWVQSASALVTRQPSRVSRLTATERHELDAACAPGFAALCRRDLKPSPAKTVSAMKVETA